MTDSRFVEEESDSFYEELIEASPGNRSFCVNKLQYYVFYERQKKKNIGEFLSPTEHEAIDQLSLKDCLAHLNMIELEDNVLQELLRERGCLISSHPTKQSKLLGAECENIESPLIVTKESLLKKIAENSLFITQNGLHRIIRYGCGYLELAEDVKNRLRAKSISSVSSVSSAHSSVSSIEEAGQKSRSFSSPRSLYSNPSSHGSFSLFHSPMVSPSISPRTSFVFFPPPAEGIEKTYGKLIDNIYLDFKSLIDGVIDATEQEKLIRRFIFQTYVNTYLSGRTKENKHTVKSKSLQDMEIFITNFNTEYPGRTFSCGKDKRIEAQVFACASKEFLDYFANYTLAKAIQAIIDNDQNTYVNAVKIIIRMGVSAEKVWNDLVLQCGEKNLDKVSLQQLKIKRNFLKRASSEEDNRDACDFIFKSCAKKQLQACVEKLAEREPTMRRDSMSLLRL